MAIRMLLAFLAVMDLGLGLCCVLAPEIFIEFVWPQADADTLFLIRRTGAIWLFFAVAELAAWQKPNLMRRRLVAALRFMDIVPDLLWVTLAYDELSAMGRILIEAAPPFNLLVGIWLWYKPARAPAHEPLYFS